MQITPTGQALGARITGIDLARPPSEAATAAILAALGTHGVLCFPDQDLDAAAHDPALPEVMVLYANPGYTMRIDGMEAQESGELLDFLFRHQERADYLPHEARFMLRVQVMADRLPGAEAG